MVIVDLYCIFALYLETVLIKNTIKTVLNLIKNL